MAESSMLTVQQPGVRSGVHVQDDDRLVHSQARGRFNMLHQKLQMNPAQEQPFATFPYQHSFCECCAAGHHRVAVLKNACLLLLAACPA